MSRCLPPTLPSTFRALTEADCEILGRATELNLNWEQQRFDRAAIADDRKLAHYCELRPERGDFGFVVESKAEPIGVVWLLQLGARDPGYGFVNVGTPELSVCVWPDFRGRGLGRALISAALEEGRRRGLLQASLSVEAGNPALRLYRALGFRPVAHAAAGTYAVNL